MSSLESRNLTVARWVIRIYKLIDQIHPGQELRAWSDIGDSYVLWQIESDGNRLLTHEMSSQAANRRRWSAAGMGLVFFSLPIVFWFVALAKHRQLLRAIRIQDETNSCK